MPNQHNDETLQKTETKEGIRDAPDYETYTSADCLCCNTKHTMCMLDIENTLYKSSVEINNQGGSECPYYILCGYGSVFDTMTLTFKEAEDWMMKYNTDSPFVCDRCIARYMIQGKLFTHQYSELKRLADFPDGVDLGKAQMEAHRLRKEW